MHRQVIQSKGKKRVWFTRVPPIADLTNGTAWCSLTLQNTKQCLKQENINSRIIFFLSQFTSIQDLKNNNWIILDQLGNIREICANPALMTLKHFWTGQAELCLKCTFNKASFMFVTIFSDINKNSKRKRFINISCPKHFKIINWNKKWQISIITLLCSASKKVLIRSETWKRSLRIRHLSFSRLFRIGMTRVNTVFLSSSRIMLFSFP